MFYELWIDIRFMNGEVVYVILRKIGMIIFGGGLLKYYICNVNMMCNGVDYVVFINIG